MRIEIVIGVSGADEDIEFLKRLMIFAVENKLLDENLENITALFLESNPSADIPDTLKKSS